MEKILRGAAIGIAAAMISASAGCSMRSRAEKRYGAAVQRYGAVVQNSAQATENEFRGAVASFKEIVDTYPAWEKSADILFTVGWMYANRGQFDKAREALVRLYMYFPQRYVQCSRAMYLAALTYEKQGDEKNAVKGFRQVHERYPETDAGLRAPFHICEYYRRQGKEDDYDRASEWAVGEYRDAVSGDPDGRTAAAAQSYIMDTLSLGGKWNEAATVFERIASDHPGTATAPPALLRAAVLCTEKLDRPEKALALLDRLVREYPRDPLCLKARFEKGELFMRQGDTARAEETYAEIGKLYAQDSPLCAAALLALGRGYEGRGQGDRAVELYEQAAARYPYTLPALQASLQAAEWYLQQGRSEAAGKVLDRVVGAGRAIIERNAGRETTVEAYRCIAAALCVQKKWPESIAALKALRKAYPREAATAPALFALGTIYLEELHDLPRARFWFTMLTNEFPGHRSVRSARQMLERIATGDKP